MHLSAFVIEPTGAALKRACWMRAVTKEPYRAMHIVRSAARFIIYKEERSIMDEERNITRRELIKRGGTAALGAAVGSGFLARSGAQASANPQGEHNFLNQEPVFDVAQLSHIELLTPKLDESLRVFKDLLGLQETARDGTSVYLRGYQESYHHSLKLTESNQAGLGHVGWRATSQAALERRVAKIEQMGAGIGWTESEAGYGPAYAYRTPDGHLQHLFWEVERAVIPEDQRSPLLNRPQKRPLNGVPVRRLDHVSLMASDAAAVRKFYQEAQGIRLREILLDNGAERGAWLSHSNLNHDVTLVQDGTGSKGRFHHVAFYYGIPQHMSDLADILREQNIQIDAGPGVHGITQGAFLYFFEPGGNRIEVYGDEGYLIFEPDWEPRVWTEKDLDIPLMLSWYGGQIAPESAFIGTPHVPMPEGVPSS